MVEPLSSLREGEIAEVVWIISEADIRDMLGRNGFLSGETVTCLFKNPARQLCVYKIRRRVVAMREEYTKRYWYGGYNIRLPVSLCNYNAL